MTTYIAHFIVCDGVSTQIELVLEDKNYDESAIDLACKILAFKLDLRFLYWEEK